MSTDMDALVERVAQRLHDERPKMPWTWEEWKDEHPAAPQEDTTNG